MLENNSIPFIYLDSVKCEITNVDGSGGMDDGDTAWKDVMDWLARNDPNFNSVYSRLCSICGKRFKGETFMRMLVYTYVCANQELMKDLFAEKMKRMDVETLSPNE